MQKFKTLASGALGTLLTGASLLAPALAADLSNFGAWTPANTLIVVGDQANAVDIVGGMNIAAAVAQHGATSTAKSASSLVGAVQKDNLLKDQLSTQYGSANIKSNKLSGFKKGTYSWNSKDVDYEEQLYVGGLTVFTSDNVVANTAYGNEDFASTVYLGTTSTGAVKYQNVVSDTDLNTTAVSSDKALTVDFLGTQLKITSVSVANSQITYQAGTKATLGVGGQIVVNGKTLTVKSIGQTSVSIDVDGQSEIISSGTTAKQIGTTPVKVDVNSILYTDDAASRQTSIVAGTDTTKTVTDGDPLTLFGEPDSVSSAVWVWDVIGTGTTALTVGAVHNQVWNAVNKPMVAAGSSLVLPGKYASIDFNGLTVDNNYQYTADLTQGINVAKLDDSQTAPSTNSDSNTFKALRLVSSKKNDGFLVTIQTGTAANYTTDTVYLTYGNTTDDKVRMAFVNSNGNIQYFNSTGLASSNSTATQLYLNDESTILPVTVKYSGAATTGIVNVTLGGFGTGVGGSNDVVINGIDIVNQRMGGTRSTSESGEVVYSGTSIGTRTKDLRTAYGSVFYNPDSNGKADKYTWALPSEKVKATTTVNGNAGTTGSVGGVSFVSLGSGFSKVASTVSAADKSGKNLILVGGPYANALVDELATAGKTYTKTEWNAMAGKAIVQYVAGGFATGNDVIIAAGYAAADTQAASLSLATTALTGTGQSWMGTTQTAFTYTAPKAETTTTTTTTTTTP